MIDRLLKNRYHILNHLGTGGMAAVYRARDTVLQREVAVKVLLPQYAHDGEFIKRFQREAQAVASLSHHNIVSIYDVGQEGDNHFIVMEYVAGTTLKEMIIQEAPLTLHKALKITFQVAEALIHAHYHRVIHRDIKPHNILITPNHQAKVTDFGIAKAATDATQTHTTSIMGSAHYFSPEQARGNFTGASSDIYSLGIVLYEMLTGKVPFQGPSPVSIALKHIQEPPENPSKYNSHIPDEIEKVIMKALEKDQTYRYHDAAVFLRELKVSGGFGVQEVFGGHDSERNEGLNKSYPTRELYASNYIGNAGVPYISEKNNQNLEVTRKTDKAKDGRISADLDCEPLDKDSSPAASYEQHKNENNKRAVQESAKKKLKIAPVKFVLIMVVLLSLIGGTAWGMNQLRAILYVPEVAVPDVEGKPLSEAEELLRDKNLDISVTEASHADVEALHVIAQAPDAESIVREHRTVSLTISTGPEYLEVPELTGLSERQAIIELRRTGLEYELEREYSEKIEKGNVISQYPEMGAEVGKDEEVLITISEGREPFPLDSYIGYEITEVEDALAEHELELRNKFEIEDEALPADVVAKQEPEAGSQIQPGDGIDVWINSIEAGEDEIEFHTKTLEGLPTGQKIRVVVDDYLGENVVYEGITESDTMELEIAESGIIEVYKYEEGSDEYSYDIIPFP